jgi:hypothetical protein
MTQAEDRGLPESFIKDFVGLTPTALFYAKYMIDSIYAHTTQ